MPPAPSLWLVGCFLYFSAEICAGSLVSGCAGSLVSRVRQFTVIFGADVVSSSVPKVSFGILVAVNLTTWGTIERFRRTWEHKKGDHGLQV